MTSWTLSVMVLTLAGTAELAAQEGESPVLYPFTHERAPIRASPSRVGGTELLLVRTRAGREALVPVTVENGPLCLPYGSSRVGKGRQLEVDATDFPTLARTGLHSEEELRRVKTITGRPIEEITALARPGRASEAGFLAADETLLEVLEGDNALVRRLGLTHPDLARPLFHVWNLILQQHEHGRLGRHHNDIVSFRYGGAAVSIRAHATRGFQESIFDDGVRGSFDITLERELLPGEKAMLGHRYAHLRPAAMDALVKRLSRLRVGEIAPYYVMRYGFYEGHTPWRADPVAIAFIFGLRDLEQIEGAFPSQLDRVLCEHFAPE
jgi:hypothetical protein